VEKKGVFVYRTIEDLERILAYAEGAVRAAVIGGGLLGLEAAKAVRDLDLETHVIELAPRLMPRQVDEAGGRILRNWIEGMGVSVHLGKSTRAFVGNGKVEGVEFTDGHVVPVDMVVISAGICPRDELARDCGLEVGPRGGVVVDDLLQTSDPGILAIGEVALHSSMIYGLVAPGYEMAEIAAANLTGKARVFTAPKDPAAPGASAAFLGEDWGKFTPVGDELELNLGTAQDIVAVRTIEKTQNIRIAGNLFDRVVIVKYELENFRDGAVTLDIREDIGRLRADTFGQPRPKLGAIPPVQWELMPESDIGEPDKEKTSFDNALFHVDLPAKGADGKAVKVVKRLAVKLKNEW